MANENMNNNLEFSGEGIEEQQEGCNGEEGNRERDMGKWIIVTVIILLWTMYLLWAGHGNIGTASLRILYLPEQDNVNSGTGQGDEWMSV